MGIDALPEKDAQMLTLFYLRELSLEEMADILDMAANTIKVAVHRARQKLAGKMLELLGEEVYELLNE